MKVEVEMEAADSQTRLGHSSAEITMSVYAHAMPARDLDAAASLDSALFGGGAL